MTKLTKVAPLLLRGRVSAGHGLVDLLAIAAFTLSSWLLLIVLAGVNTFYQRQLVPPAAFVQALGDHAAEGVSQLVFWTWLAVCAGVLLIVPVMSLGAGAARMGALGRDQRLSTLRLLGVTGGQAVALSTLETMLSALLGAMVGTLGYLVTLPGWAMLKREAKKLTNERDDRTTIRAPIAGVIGLTQATTGALVAAQQTTALTTIRALDPVYVDVTQSATDILRLTSTPEGRAMRAVGEAGLILADGSAYPMKGRLQAAEPRVEPTTGMVTLRMSFPNPDHILLPGMYVEVDLPQALAKGAFALPQNVVMREPSSGAYVWVVDQGKVAQKPVTVATSSGTDWIVTSGLSEGDQVITSGFQKTGPGAPVAVVPAEAQ